jgi:hypothetical protein
VGERGDEGAVGKRLGAQGVEETVAGGLSFGDGEGGEIGDVDRLEAVGAASEEQEDREAAEQEGDVVDEDVAGAEEHRGSEDGVRDVEGLQGLRV